MMNIELIKKKACAPIRQEIRWVEERYELALRKVSVIIDGDPSIDPMDKMDRKNHLAKVLWDDVYGSYKKELLAVIRAINSSSL